MQFFPSSKICMSICLDYNITKAYISSRYKKHEDFMFKSKIERPKPLSKTPGSGAYETNKSTLKKGATKMNNQFGSTVKRGNQWRNPESVRKDFAASYHCRCNSMRSLLCLGRQDHRKPKSFLIIFFV